MLFLFASCRTSWGENVENDDVFLCMSFFGLPCCFSWFPCHIVLFS